jgi:FtsH-binding integral membrane protein
LRHHRGCGDAVALMVSNASAGRRQAGAGRRPAMRSTMRFIHLYLIGYFVLALGVTLALWQTGVLGRVPPIWIGVGALVAIGLGIMVSVSSGKPTVSEEEIRN